MALAIRPVEQARPHARASALVSEREPRLPALTGVRFMAALGVVLTHVWRVDPVPQAFAAGFLGVNLFFILSGFILAYNYIDAERGGLRVSPRRFWVARIARIYPVYLIGVVCAIGPYLWDRPPGAPTVPTVLASLPLLQAWLPYSANALNPAAWSLSAEAFFYLFFPLLARPSSRFTARQATWLAFLLWLGMVVLGTLVVVVNPDHLQAQWWQDGYWRRVFTFLPALRLPEFVLGIALARLFARRGAAPHWLAPAGAMVTLLVLLTAQRIPNQLWVQGLADPALAAIVYGLAAGRGRLARTLATPFACALGKASYALFILHYPLFEWLARFIGIPFSVAQGRFDVVAAYLVLAIAVALLVHHYIERPARLAIHRALG